MSVELSNRYPNVKRVTLGGIDVLTEVLLPDWTRKVSVQFITNNGKVAFEGTDGEAIGTDYATVTADAWFEITWCLDSKKNTGRTSVFVASGSASTVVEVLIEG